VGVENKTLSPPLSGYVCSGLVLRSSEPFTFLQPFIMKADILMLKETNIYGVAVLDASRSISPGDSSSQRYET
jgi:hypothetical protein